MNLPSSTRDNIIQDTLVDGGISTLIYEIRSKLGMDRNPAESINSDDFRTLKDLNIISIMSKAPFVKPRINKLGNLFSEALNDQVLSQRSRSYPAIVGLALAIWGTGSKLTLVLELLRSEDAHEYIIDQLKTTFPDFGGTLDLIMMGLNTAQK